MTDMTDMFEFDESPWEAALAQLQPGERISGLQLLMLLEDENQDTAEEALDLLNEKRITLDISDLPKPAGTGEAALRLRREEELVRENRLLESLEENDPLRLYLQELAATPVYGDPAVLAHQAAEGDEAARTMLTNHCLGRAVQLAGEFTGKGVLLLDLIQEGSLGIWISLQSDCGDEFEALRDWRIRQYMSRAVFMQARERGVGQKMRLALEDYRAVDERLLADLGRNPTLEEIAEQMHISVEEAENVKLAFDNARMLQMAKPPVEEDEPEEDPEEQQAVEDTAYFQSRQRIAELLADLPAQDVQLISLRFGLEGGLPMSPEEAGRKLGLTPEEVVQREAAALAKLRQG